MIDNLCDDGRGDNPTITCFYFDFTARKEQPPVSMLGSLLKQLVFRLGEMPEEISWAYKTERMQLGGGGGNSFHDFKKCYGIPVPKSACLCALMVQTTARRNTGVSCSIR